MWWFITPLFLTSILGLFAGALSYWIANTFDSEFFEYLTELFLVPFLMFIFLAPINIVWNLLVLIWSPFL